MPVTLTKRLQRSSVSLSDLDGLLVNSRNFHEVFIQKIDPKWISATINRVVKSESHLKKFVQILVKFIVSEKHPEWVYHALVWLTHLCRSPLFQSHVVTPELREVLRPLLSHATEMSGLRDMFAEASLLGTAAEHWTKGCASRSGIPHNLYYGGLFDIPSTGYVYVDDSDEEFGQRQARLNSKNKGPYNQTQSVSPNVVEQVGPDEDEGIDYSDINDDEEDENDSEEEGDEGEDQISESDHGVFDVNETASSDDPHTIDPVYRTSSILFPDESPKGDKPTDRESSDEVATGSEDSEDSDEELEWLMWTRNEQDSEQFASSESDSEPLKRSPVQPNSKRSRKKSTQHPDEPKQKHIKSTSGTEPSIQTSRLRTRKSR